jgi:hypothetical protein
MSQHIEYNEPDDRPLRRMLRLVRERRADQQDAAEAMREMRLVRLEMLAEELDPVIAEVPEDDPQFDFVISSGLQPRLWIDATTHVAMGRDGRTYRLLQDTRTGRVVLAEADRTGPIVEAVTRHIAERIQERRRLLEGRREPARPVWTAWPADGTAALSRWGEYAAGVALVLLGMIAGAAILIVLLSEQFLK